MTASGRTQALLTPNCQFIRDYERDADTMRDRSAKGASGGCSTAPALSSRPSEARKENEGVSARIERKPRLDGQPCPTANGRSKIHRRQVPGNERRGRPHPR